MQAGADQSENQHPGIPFTSALSVLGILYLPPFRPFDLMWCFRVAPDLGLFASGQLSVEPGEGGLDDPGGELEAGCVAGAGDISDAQIGDGFRNIGVAADDDAGDAFDLRDVALGIELLHGGKRQPGGGDIALKPAFDHLQHEGFGGGDLAFFAVLSDGDNLAEDIVIGKLSVPSGRAAFRIATLALPILAVLWRAAIADAVIIHQLSSDGGKRIRFG